MKNLFYISFLFFSVLSFGQPVYRVTEGEVQLINPRYGIVILKDNSYYRLEITRDFYHRKQKEITLQPIEESKVKELLTNEKTIFYKDIDENYDFEKLKELSFLYTYDDKETIKNKKHDIYKLCQFNQNFFAIFQDRYDDENIYTSVEEVLPYMFIEFGNKKIIYTYTEDYYLIPVKGKLKVFDCCYDYLYLPFHKTQKLKLSNREIYEFSQHTYHDLGNKFFVVDTLPNKKVRLKNVYDEVLIKQSYDSISISPLIECYNGGKIDLYNLTYKKLNKTPLKASKGGRGLASLQIIEKNKVKRIDWTGKQIKKVIGYGYIDLNHYMTPDYGYEISTSKNKGNFNLKIKYLGYLGYETERTITDSIPLINTKGIKDFYFRGALKDTVFKYESFYYYNDSIKPKITDFVNFSYEEIYFQKEDGTYGVNYLGNFLENNPEYFYEEHSDIEKLDEYQNLQFIEYKYLISLYKMKKNNLYMLYPLQKDFRYKKLGDFQGNFARFELPNGQKGWLDLQGNKYLDE